MKDIAIVHNGIIENYSSLKQILKNEGYEFQSETDSEVLVHLISKFYRGDLKEAVVTALKLAEGTFGILVLHKDNKKIIAARKGSSLIIGVGNNEMFVASDISAILEHTRKVVYLKDNEIAEVGKENYYIETLDGEKVKAKIDEIKWSLQEVEKKGFKHFMLKEILEQPTAIENTLRGRVKNGSIKLSLNLASIPKRIVILGCGTS